MGKFSTITRTRRICCRRACGMCWVKGICVFSCGGCGQVGFEEFWNEYAAEAASLCAGDAGVGLAVRHALSVTIRGAWNSASGRFGISVLAGGATPDYWTRTLFAGVTGKG